MGFTWLFRSQTEAKWVLDRSQMTSGGGPGGRDRGRVGARGPCPAPAFANPMNSRVEALRADAGTGTALEVGAGDPDLRVHRGCGRDEDKDGSGDPSRLHELGSVREVHDPGCESRPRVETRPDLSPRILSRFVTTAPKPLRDVFGA